MSSHDLQILGAWKDGALQESKENEFDPNNVSFNRKWSPGAASVAYQTWKEAARELGEKMTGNFPADAAEFLKHWSERQGLCGTRTKCFGLSRATTLLHFVSGGRYPIFDSRVRRAVKKLTGVSTINGVEWYMKEFCTLFRELERQCESTSDPRPVDKALFAYGGKD